MYFSKVYMQVTQNIKNEVCVEKQKIILEDTVFETTKKIVKCTAYFNFCFFCVRQTTINGQVSPTFWLGVLVSFFMFQLK